MSGSLIPNGKQQFIDSNGNPLASGKVYYYIPNTTTPKNTYQDAALTILNTNPIILDANGQCEAWANSGSFRQQVYDVNNNLIWDVESDAPASYGDIATLQADIAAFESSSGATLIGYKEGGAGSVTRTVAAKLNEFISVKDFGAVGDGVTDDTLAIQAAIAYVETLANGTIYFSDGNYLISSTLSITSDIGVQCSGKSSITTTNNTFTVFQLGPNFGFTNQMRFPSIYGGLIAIHFYGCINANVTIGSINNAVDGVVFEANGTTLINCAGNTINFNLINLCSGSAIKFAYTGTTGSLSACLMQGNVVLGGGILSCLYGTHWYDSTNSPSGSGPSWDDTVIDIPVIDNALITGSICSFGDPTFPAGRITHQHRTFFGGGAEAFIKGDAHGNLFQLAFGSQIDYAKMQLTGVGNNIVNTAFTTSNFSSSPVAMTTTNNSISTFNGGVPLSGNRTFMSFNIPSPLSAGQAAVFYFYHPLMQFYGGRVTFEPYWDMFAAPLVVSYCVEHQTAGVPNPNNTTANPFEGAFEVYSVGSVPAGTYLVIVTVNDVAQ